MHAGAPDRPPALVPNAHSAHRGKSYSPVIAMCICSATTAAVLISVLSKGGVPAPQTASTLFALLAPVGFATTLLGVVRSARRSQRRAAVGLVAIGLAVFLFVLVPAYSDIAKRGARPLKAQADVRAIARAVDMYRARTGALPESLADLTSATTNTAGQVGGPFLARVPSAPTGRTPYRYEPRPDGTFRIESRGAGPPPGR